MTVSLFKQYPEEAKIVGRILAGYTGVECALMNLVATAIGDLDTVLKVMYKPNKAADRIEMANALGRRSFHARELETEFQTAIVAMRYCAKIRNQFGHCIWSEDSENLRIGFVNLPEVAELDVTIKNLERLTKRWLTQELLEAQEDYFVQTTRFLSWLDWECRVQDGNARINPVADALLPEQPSLYVSDE